MTPLAIILIILGLAGGAAAGYFLPEKMGGLTGLAKITGTTDKKRLEDAKQEAASIRQKAEENANRLADAMKTEAENAKKRFERTESLIKQKEERVEKLKTRNKAVQEKLTLIENSLGELNQKAGQTEEQLVSQLSQASGIKPEQAKQAAEKELKELITKNSKRRAAAELEEFEEDIVRHAKSVVQLVIQRLGVPSSVDKNSTSITIKDEKIKGMLIGKGGKNVAYLESLLPVSILFNQGDHQAIYVGGLNLLRRNVAKRAINKLKKRVKKKRRIDHPMIKEAVEDAERELMQDCDIRGKKALKEMGLNPEETPKELVNFVGRMYYRTSYGQNIIHHSLEMAHAARLISELIGTDSNVAMQAAFYHDIGKAIDHDIGGIAHDDLSKVILEKHGYDPAIVHAAYAHHDKVPCEAPADFIVKAVDAISGGRPGARQESIFNYFERIKALEDAAKSFKGVKKVYTMSAGREIRVMVHKDQIKDDTMQELADNVAGKISEEVSFPGVIKVNLIRKTTSVDYAKDKRKLTYR